MPQLTTDNLAATAAADSFLVSANSDANVVGSSGSEQACQVSLVLRFSPFSLPRPRTCEIGKGHFDLKFESAH